MSETAQILERANKVLIGNYARQPFIMVRGQGSEVWDSDGKRYIDLFAGFGGAILGHCHPALIDAADAQMRKLWHVGNTFHSLPQIALSEALCRHAFQGQAFFCHSGLEANEAACKLARLRGHEFSPNRWKILSLSRSFHGRSLAMIAATGNPAVKQGFEPAVAGFVQVAADSIEAIAAAIDDQTAAILMEPIQGEGGVNVYHPGYAKQVRQLCDQRGICLIFDEVWTGCARTGRWFGYQHFGQGDDAVEPDILTLGKALGGGLPVGAMFAKPQIAKLLVPGKHGCTLGGNPVCMAVSNAIFQVIEREGLVERARHLGQRVIGRLRSQASIQSRLQEIRGHGLMLGIELQDPPTKLVERGLDSGIIVNLTASKVIRLAPALTIPEELLDRGLDQLVRIIAG